MKVIEVSKKYLGIKEISGNKGFLDKKFEAKMAADGFIQGDAWCCLAQEMIWEEAYPDHEKEFDRLFHKSCDQTFKNFKAAGYEFSTIPVVGCLIIIKKFI
jgi:hypothetical protein